MIVRRLLLVITSGLQLGSFFLFLVVMELYLLAQRIEQLRQLLKHQSNP